MDNQIPQVIATTTEWRVIAKPAGWLTIPGRGPETPVLQQWVEQTTGEKSWVVHRIDRETSGMVLFARTAEAHRKANGWFQNHQVKKTYHCLAEGVPHLPILKIKKPIEGAASLTQVEIKESYLQGFLAQVQPQSGRRHQIRIHLAGEGFPLWGDTQYGGRREVSFPEGKVLPVGRVALHAARLELPGGERFEAPWPLDFERWVKVLREEGQRV